MIQTWKIAKNKHDEIKFSNASSLDVVTRQLPEGYYSTFRTYDGCTRVIGLSAHLQRLPGIDASSLRRHLNQLLEPYRPNEVRARVMKIKGGQTYISIEPLKLPPCEVYEKGVRVETTEINRESPRIKSTAFISQSEKQREYIARKGIFEALMVRNGRILEGMTSNFFYIIHLERNKVKSKGGASATGLTKITSFAQPGILYTARRDILLGITRRTVIRVARGEGVEMRYIPLKLDQLPMLSEAFITSSSRGIVPVIQIDDVTVGKGRVGRITKQLSAAYGAYVMRKAERI